MTLMLALLESLRNLPLHATPGWLLLGCTILGALLQLLVGADGGDGIVTVIAVLTSPILVVIPFVMVIWWVTRIGTNDGSFGLGWVTVGYLTFGSVAQVGQFQFDVLTSMRPLLIFLILVSGGLSLGLRRILFARIWRAGDLPMVGLSTLAWLPEFVGTQVILWSLLLNLDDDGYQLPTVSSSTLLIGRSLIVFSYLATVVILLVVTVNQHRVITAEQEHGCLRVERLLFDRSVAEMAGASSKIYLMAKPAGSATSLEDSAVRDYRRHWTPVHLDFEVDDVSAAVERAVTAGAKLEGAIQSFSWGRQATLSDPFGHGFCLLGKVG